MVFRCNSLDYKRGYLNEKFKRENLSHKDEIFDPNLEKFKIVITTSSNQQALFFKLKKSFSVDKILFVKSMCISTEKPSFKPSAIKIKRQ